MVQWLFASPCPAALPLLLMMLTLMCCSSGCFAASLTYHCSFDDAMRVDRTKSMPVVMKNVPSGTGSASQTYTVIGENGWAPIRINVSTRDLDDASKYCSSDYSYVKNPLTGYYDCQGDALSSNKRKVLIDKVVPAAVKLHADRLLVQPLEGPLVVPQFAAGSVCSRFTVPAEHRSKGVANSDMMLYVAAAPGGVWALPCATLEDGRPVVGVMNIAPAVLFHGRLATRIAAHLMAHALGFAHPHMASRSMVRNVTGVRGRALSVVVNSTNAAMAAREHYDCDDIYGMELQDQNGDGGTLESHWSQRHAKDELMAPIGGAGYYTELTLAAFADLGYFKVNWKLAEPMGWGKKSGCELLQKRCSELNLSKYSHMFCNRDEVVERCASDRYSRGLCRRSIIEFSKQHSMDSCPIIDPAMDVRDLEAVFEKEGYLSARPGDKPSSWCLDTLPTNTTDGRYPEETYLSAAMHAELKCLGMQVHVRVPEKRNVRWLPCTEEETITWDTPPYNKENVICPKYAEVCTISATGGSVIPVVSWDDEERVWGRTVRPEFLRQSSPEAPVPGAESIGSGRGTESENADSAALQSKPLPQGDAEAAVAQHDHQAGSNTSTPTGREREAAPAASGENNNSPTAAVAGAGEFGTTHSEDFFTTEVESPMGEEEPSAPEEGANSTTLQSRETTEDGDAQPVQESVAPLAGSEGLLPKQSEAPVPENNHSESGSGASQDDRLALLKDAKLMLHDWNVDSTARVCVSRVSMLLLLGLCGAVAVL
ncbi:surface protease GP63, putative [Trypanosoma cruzi]|uniref:Leishmanolysin-like peptidase n=1 Tax=Trypanosoma cruzi (strain CL Brener) TaxID=353153 RepID=Q4CNY8_TRYCC|nr:surface protease GP63, putative [Trypanosoma cruzi]EAN81991.1 surface protease GP63, putative [Trypanosoma cruzi]|eukprot:XP_803689.1 surface protease GP63 [Trypanosoma cruzi strain CL Brener]